MDKRYITRRQRILKNFQQKSMVPDSVREDLSPSGKYKIESSNYAKGNRDWGYSRGIVTRVTDNKIIADVIRNIGHFWHSWVNLPGKDEYLLCGEDYQGYTIVNLTRGETKVYFPEEGYRGGGFCWTNVFPSPDGKILAVDGCFWAAPYDLVFFDFRDPSHLPFPEIDRVKNIDRTFGWINNKQFEYTIELEIRKSDGVPYDSLEKEEQEILEKDYKLVGYRYETLTYERPESSFDDL